MNPTKRNYLIIAGVVILLATIALGIVLNKRNATQNPELPAQVGQISDLSTATNDAGASSTTINRANTIDLSATSSATTSTVNNEVTVNDASNPTGSDVTTNDAIIVTTNSPASVPENPNPDLVAVAMPTNDSNPASTDTSTRDQFTSTADTGCMDSTGQPIACPDSGNDNTRPDSTQPQCDPASGANCEPTPCDPNTDPTCGGGVPNFNPDPNEPQCDPATQDCGGNDLNCQGAGCTPEPQCDPATQDCGGSDFSCEGPGCTPTPECDPNTDPTCANTFEPPCTGDSCGTQTTEPACDPNTENCNPPVEYTPPVRQETPVSQPVHPSAPAQPIKPVKLNDSGPANIALLLMSPIAAYLATKRRRK